MLYLNKAQLVVHYCYIEYVSFCETNRIYKAWKEYGKSSKISKLSIERVVQKTLSRDRKIAKQGANYTPTVSIVQNRMAMTTEHFKANFKILHRVHGFGLEDRIRSGYFSDIDTLLLREAISVVGVKIAAIESHSICTGGRRACSHRRPYRTTMRQHTRNMVAYKPSNTATRNRCNCECTERMNKK